MSSVIDVKMPPNKLLSIVRQQFDEILEEIEELNNCTNFNDFFIEVEILNAHEMDWCSKRMRPLFKHVWMERKARQTLKELKHKENFLGGEHGQL